MSRQDRFCKSELRWKEALERVEAANGPDREIDEMLLALRGFEKRDGRWYLDDLLTRVDPVSASVDHVIALIDFDLKTGWTVADAGMGGRAIIYQSDGDVFGYGKTAALALLAAYLQVQIVRLFHAGNEADANESGTESVL